MCQIEEQQNFSFVFVMELYDYELELQSEIVNWKCLRDVDCLMKFIPKPRHVKLGMKGLVWSIQALPLPLRESGCSSFSFTIMEVKRSRGPLALSTASAAPDLPAKFKLFLQRFEMSMKSVSLADKALDKLYAFSRLYSLAEEDKLWEIIADAEISAAACITAREASQEAAEAAAAFLLDIEPPPPLLFFFKRGAIKKGLICARSGWWIEQWTIVDELWASEAFPEQGSEAITRILQAKAVEQGNVLQWCRVKVLERMCPCFEFEIGVEKFLEGDDLILRIGLVNHRALKVRVLFTEDAHASVVCSQEGVETETSLGLGHLLPHLIRDHIKAALENSDSQQNNIVEGLLQFVAGYLASLSTVCVVCGRQRPLEVPQMSACSDICEARKQAFEDALPRAKISEDSNSENLRRREVYVRNLFCNTEVGRQGLSDLVVEKREKQGISKRDKEGKEAALQAEEGGDPSAWSSRRGKKKKKQGKIISYEEAVSRVARMESLFLQPY